MVFRVAQQASPLLNFLLVIGLEDLIVCVQENVMQMIQAHGAPLPKENFIVNIHVGIGEWRSLVPAMTWIGPLGQAHKTVC